MNIYTELPSELRGNNLESHTGWPRQWTTPDVQHAMRTRIALQHIIDMSGIPYTVDIISHDTETVITVNRNDLTS